MQIFYAPDITGYTYVLDEKESRHSVRVLRLKKGSPVRLIDGRGNMYEGVITDPDFRRCVIGIKSVVENFGKRDYRLHIGISPVKNHERFEWFVEKSVEIGIDEITPLICRHTEKSSIKSARVRNIIIAAMKQSIKAENTALNEPCLFNDFINYGHKGELMIAYCDQKIAGSKISDVYSKGRDAVILIGPEGDFTEDEINSAISRGFRAVNLGNSRLRTETAGIVACHSVYFLNL